MRRTSQPVLVGLSEKPKPGSDGAIRWNAYSGLPPWPVGLVSGPRSTPIAKSDVPGDVVVKAGNTPKRWLIHRNKSTIAHEVTITSVIDQNASELQVTEASALLGKKLVVVSELISFGQRS